MFSNQFRIIEIFYITPTSSSVFSFCLFFLYTTKKKRKKNSLQRKNTLKRVNRNSSDDSLTNDFERTRSGSKVRSFWELIFRNDAASKSKTCSTLEFLDRGRSPYVSQFPICGSRLGSNEHENSIFRSLIHDVISRLSNWKFRVRKDNDHISIWVMATHERHRDIFNMNRNIELW